MTPMRNEHILAVDVGGSALRVGLVRLDGTIIATSAVALAPDEPRAGWSELDPERWWQALRHATARVLRRAPPVAALCIGALTRTQVLLDANGRAQGRAILFRDRRAAAIARELRDATAFDARARLAWIERHQPGRHARIAAVVEPKDYLNYRLTGVLAADRVTRSREAALPLAPDHVVDPWQAIGTVRSAALARLAGVPVFAGSLDTWTSAVGAGAVAPGQAYDVCGTSEAVGLITAQPTRVPGLLHLAWTATAHQVGGPTQAGADCARWCHDTFRISGTLASALARVGDALRADAPLFLPYLAGERAPLWSTTVRGAFHRIDRGHGPDDFLWSTLEGVGHAVRDILRRAQAGSGVSAHEVRIAGGGARSDTWCALKADVIGVPVLRTGATETGLVGAAMAAAVGLGAYPDLERAARRMARPARRFVPRPRYAAAYAQRAALYDAVRDAALALAPLP
ncbi:MAG: hypothetical protein IT522_17395 [Burkholderiales bacterium]|nr:hypothetical protein [Burkholderiales bacterium]